VPLRAEIGPKDIAKNGVFLARRDTGEKAGVDRNELVATIGTRLQAIQDNLFQRALKLREDNTRTIDKLDELLAWFTPKNANNPEIHGGFALCHFTEGKEVDDLLKQHKLTIRNMPQGLEDAPGKCVFTGQATSKRAYVAKSY
jgi:prolyl-tRNA synthetase